MHLPPREYGSLVQKMSERFRDLNVALNERREVIKLSFQDNEDDWIEIEGQVDLDEAFNFNDRLGTEMGHCLKFRLLMFSN